MSSEAELARLRHEVCAPLQLEVSDDQSHRLLGYLDLLQRWNATYNLTAVRDRPSMLIQHLADCLAVVGPLQRHLQTHGLEAARLLDVGSGGGLPAVVLAIMLPQLQITAVDTVGKKVAFVRQVAGALALANLQAQHARVEALTSPPFDLITSRAFASLADLIKFTQALLSLGGCWMAMKGKHPGDELAALPATVDVFHVEPLLVPDLHAERCLVWVRPTEPSMRKPP